MTKHFSKQKGYQIIAKSFIDYWNDELRLVRERKNGIIVLDNNNVKEFSCWEEFVDYNDIIEGSKVYNLSFSDNEKNIVNALLKSLGKEQLFQGNAK